MDWFSSRTTVNSLIVQYLSAAQMALKWSLGHPMAYSLMNLRGIVPGVTKLRCHSGQLYFEYIAAPINTASERVVVCALESDPATRIADRLLMIMS